jgi:hypothetical protein
MVPIKNDLKQNTLLKLLLNFTVKYATMRIQKKLDGLKQNDKHRLFVEADHLNLLPEKHTNYKEKHRRLDSH